MMTRLEDGRIFETMPFEFIQHDPSKSVYQYTFVTRDRRVRSSSRHKWMVWNKDTFEIEMARMDNINLEVHELFVQSG